MREIILSKLALIVLASWYGAAHQGHIMANGKPFNMYALTAAHKTIPLGSCVLVTNPRTHAAVKVTITDRGPYVKGRDIDLSMAAAQKIGTIHEGVSSVLLRKVSCGDKEESKPRR